MIVTLEESARELLSKRFDVCICGSGPAGMSLALKLASLKRNVLLLEAGDTSFSEESQKVYQGTNIGLDYFPPDVSRLRFFGGTSNHWGGWCRPLGEHDFEARDHVKYSGWPITKSDIDPYLTEAKQILDVQERKPSPDYLAINGREDNLEKVEFGFSSPTPTHFGEKFGDRIKSSKNITCVMNANLVDVVLKSGFGEVDSFVVENYSGQTFNVTAKRYVLCLGGIENARMLLNANKQVETGIGNENDLVGRYFMEHPTNTVADFLINHENPKVQSIVKGGDISRSFYAPSKEYLDTNKLVNFCARFVPNGQIKKESLTFKERLAKTMCTSDTVYAVVKEFKDKLWCYDGEVRISSEQSPNPSSRIKLGNSTDRFGNKRIEIDWQLSPIDKKTIQQATIEIGKLMAAKDIGRIRVRDWVFDSTLRLPTTAEDEVAGYHHMGTTRMAGDPKHGVVNMNLQMFGINNLYMGGSSVFPTGGYANPTLTIVQLSLRLAKHLDSVLGSALSNWGHE